MSDLCDISMLFVRSKNGLSHNPKEYSCKVQIDLNGTNKEIIKPSDNLLEFAAGQYDDPKYKLGEHEWPALKRMLKKNNSIYDQ